MYISKIDGKMNMDFMVQRDTIINANTLMYLGRKNYSQSDIDKIEAIKERQKEYFLNSDIA